MNILIKKIETWATVTGKKLANIHNVTNDESFKIQSLDSAEVILNKKQHEFICKDLPEKII